ncbi:MAG: 2Fe-2S iron-sulfur cluster-binding protein [Pseudomonadales bacterium]
MAVLHITDRDGSQAEVESDTGYSVMEILQRNSYDVAAICGGCCSCATCHVYVDEAYVDKLGALEGDEAVLVESSEFFREGQSRLSCQIEFTDQIDGIKLQLAPED